MKKYILFFLIPVLAFIEEGVIESKMYSWEDPSHKARKNLFSRALFEGETYDMEYLEMSANLLLKDKLSLSMHVPGDEEHLVIVKKGSLSLRVNDSTYSIGPGSIALLMPEEKFSIQNQQPDSCSFYLMKYRSRLPTDLTRGKTNGASFVKDWNAIPFEPHDRGGIRKFFERPTAMCKRFEMHVTSLKEGIKSHEPHTHRAEEIVLVIDSRTEMQIGEKFYKGKAGDIYFLGSNIPHAIRNDGNGLCTYFAFQFE